MSSDSPPQRPRTAGKRLALLDAYPVRIMLGIVASLGVLVLCFRLPLYETRPGVGWGPQAAGPPITLNDIREAEDGGMEATDDQSGAPISAFGATDAPRAEARKEGKRNAERPNMDPPSSQSQDSPHSQLPGTTPLHTLDQKPRAIGGLGGVYMQINYPKAARRDSIEGRLLLRFIVEEDGSTSHVQVTKSLHPLCDSSAVRAIEQARFMPGRRGGETVRVAMELPVRFKLVENSPLQANRSPSNNTER